MKHKLPYDERQTYQIGDICRIVRANNEMRYPPIKDEETEEYGLLVQIVGSYWQRCGSCGAFFDSDNNFLEWGKNLVDYSIIIPKHLNPQCYNSKGEWEYKGCWSSSQRPFGWSWVDECQLEFIRHPTKEEEKFALQEYWQHIKDYGRAFGWKDVEDETD